MSAYNPYLEIVGPQADMSIHAFQAVGGRMTLEKGGGFFGAIIGIAAAVFAPVAIPMIAESFAVSSVVAGAMYGAGTAFLSSGGDFKAAMAGGILGGVGGAFMPSAGNSVADAMNAGAGAAAAPEYAVAGSTAGTAGGTSAAANVGGSVAQTGTSAVGTPNNFSWETGAGNTLTGASADSGMVGSLDSSVGSQTGITPSQDAALRGVTTDGSQSLNVWGQPQSQQPNNQYGTADGRPPGSLASDVNAGLKTSQNGLMTEAPQASWGDRFMSGVKNSFSPEKLGEAGIKLGAQALGSALGPKTPSLDDIANQYKSEYGSNLAMTQEKAGLLRGQGDAYTSLAKNTDPGYWGQMAYNSAFNSGNAQETAALEEARHRGASPQELMSLQRKYRVNTSQNAGSNQVQGTLAGWGERDKLMSGATAAYGGMPTGVGGSSAAGLQGVYNAGNQAAQATGHAIESAFGVYQDSSGKQTGAKQTVGTGNNQKGTDTPAYG